MPEPRQQQGDDDRQVRDLPISEYEIPRASIYLTGLALLVLAGVIWLAWGSGPEPPEVASPPEREEGVPWVMEGASRDAYLADGVRQTPEDVRTSEGQAEVALSRMRPDRAAALLARLETSEAARTLALTPTWRVGSILDHLPSDPAARIFRELRRVDGFSVDELARPEADFGGMEDFPLNLDGDGLPGEAQDQPGDEAPGAGQNGAGQDDGDQQQGDAAGEAEAGGQADEGQAGADGEDQAGVNGEQDDNAGGTAADNGAAEGTAGGVAEDSAQTT